MAKALEDLTDEIKAAIAAGKRPCEILAEYPIGRTRLYQIRLTMPHAPIRMRRSSADQQQSAA